MNRRFLQLLCGCSVLSLAHAAPPLEVVKVGVFAMTPFVIAGKDVPHGVLIDFFDHEIAPRMGVRFAWQPPMTVAGLESSLASGRVMFTPILGKTPARVSARIQFVGKVDISLDPCLAVLPDSPLTRVVSPADLANLTIGWVQSGALPPFMQDKRIKFELVDRIDWASANLDKLRLGQIDAAYFSNPYTPHFYSEQSGMAIRLIGLPTRGLKLYGAFAPAAPRSLTERYERAAEEAFVNDRFSAYVKKAVLRK
jgi:ABC-type amino acid transport substrate-binding protein